MVKRVIPGNLDVEVVYSVTADNGSAYRVFGDNGQADAGESDEPQLFQSAR